MAERILDCRNLTAYFYKWWQTTLGEAQDASDSKQRETATREANGFKRAYFTARKWLYEHTDVPETNIHALIENKHGGSSILIAPARRALVALDEQGDNSKLLAFMWEHYPAQCEAIELPRPAKKKHRASGNGSPATAAGTKAGKAFLRASDTSTPTKPKRSTDRGEGRAKLIAALTKHHDYANSGCLNREPIGNNELARLANVSPSTASTFFQEQFGGHGKYRAKCQDAGTLVDALKALRGEFTPAELSRMTTKAYELGKREADEE